MVEILAELTRLRQIALDPSLLYADYRGGGAKEQAIMDTIASCIASGEKMLVFSQFTSYLDIIGAKLSEQGVKHYVITGSTLFTLDKELQEACLETGVDCVTSMRL